MEIAVKYDNRVEEGVFVIERLTKGAIINHRSFLLKDDADTDFKCLTAVSCYTLDYQKMKAIKAKRADLQKAKSEVKKEVFSSELPLALDYIIHCNPNQTDAAYQEKIQSNQFRVMFKNTVMQTWSEIKKANQKPSLKDMINELIKKKRDESRNQANSEQQQKEQANKERMERRRKRKENYDLRMQTESKDSYLNIEQFEFLHKKIEMSHKRLKEQQEYIDQMETKMITHLTQRKKKEQERFYAAKLDIN